MKKNKRVIAFAIAMVLFVTSLTTLFCGSAVSAASSTTTKEKVEGKIYYSYAWKVLSLVNKERAKRGLSKLKMSDSLIKVANTRAAEASLYFSHQRPNGKRGLDIYPWKHSVGENLSYWYRTPATVFKAWMNSPTHRKNILSKKFKSVGIGCFRAGNEFYWAQYFVDNRISKNCKKKSDCKATYTIDIKKKFVDTHQKRTEISFEENDSAKSLTLYQVARIENDYSFLTPLDADCVSFKTDDSSVADVDQNGTVVPKGNGETTVTAHVIGASDKKVIWNVKVALPHFEEETDDIDTT